MAVNYKYVSDLPIGSKIIIGKNKFTNKFQDGQEDIVWITVSKNHNTLDNGYPENATTLITEKVIRYMAFDAKEPLNALESRRLSGNARWRTSNIRQWLNSDGYGSQWFVPQNIGISGTDNTDTSPIAENLMNIQRNYPYFSDEGFLRFFTEVEKRALVKANITTTIPTDSENQSPELPKSEITNDLFYLPSYREVTGSTFIHNVNYAKEGERVIPNDKRNAMATNLSLINGAYYSYSLLTNKDYVFRSPANNSEVLKYFDDGINGSYVKSKPYDNFGIRPMTNIRSNSVVVETETTGVYRLVDNAKPTVVLNQVTTEQTGYGIDFNVFDYDDNISNIVLILNNEVLRTFNVSSVNSFHATHVIPYTKMVYGMNRLQIRATDTRGEVTVKNIDLELKGINSVKNGDKIATKDGVFNVESAIVTKNGQLKLTLDRNLKSKILKSVGIVELYNVEITPSIFINDDFKVIPQYTDMILNSIDYHSDGTATEEWQFIGFGTYVHTKVLMNRKTTQELSQVSRISQIFTFSDEI